jgi:uncharacterized membrane protein
MERICSISGKSFPEAEGLEWRNLRPSLQAYLKSMHEQLDDNSFISYEAFNRLVKTYIAGIAAEEIQANAALAQSIQQQMQEDESLQPIDFGTDDEKLSFGQRLADNIADFGGSWPFIIIFLTFLFAWMILNTFVLREKAYDNYPYILLNLILSCLAALQAPVIMMSQNRQETKDRQHAEYDFRVNKKAEAEVRLLHEKLDHLLLHQHQNMIELLQMQMDVIQQLQQRIDKDNVAAAPKANG